MKYMDVVPPMSVDFSWVERHERHVACVFFCNMYLFLSHYSGAPAVDGDPHFMIELPDRGDALCFNINDKPGTIFNLVRDSNSGQPHVHSCLKT